ncbi:MAG: cytoskeletal protein CcmA (bactofilin family) [Alphaproteobacteria bacterium]|jgi:cytoskeletal protein CcmA (bactofilin family)
MSMSDSEKTTIPLATRNRPDIPPKRRDGEGLSSSMSQGSRMTVGPGIELKGEISNCAALVVEGNVEATLNGEGLEISQRGVFKGTARVETADIQGQFEGELTVSGLLRIENGGSVSGQIVYGRIEIVAGGELSGQISKAGVKEVTPKPITSVGIAAEAD